MVRVGGLRGELAQCRQLLLGRGLDGPVPVGPGGQVDGHVGVLDRPDVVVPDLLVPIVTLLLRVHSHVDRSIVHDRERDAVLPGEALIVQFVIGDARRALEVVAKPEGVTHLVQDQVANRITQVLLRHLGPGRQDAQTQQRRVLYAQLLCLADLGHAEALGQLRRKLLAEALCLHEPLDHALGAGEVLPVEQPAAHEGGRDQHVGVQQLAGARIGLRGPDGVAHAVGRGPADGGVADVLGAPLGILLRRRRLLRHDGVLEAGRLEGLVPAFDPLLHVLPVLHRDRPVDVEDDGRNWLGQLSRGVPLLEAPALDVAHVPGRLLIFGEVLQRGEEVTDTVVGVARLHRLLRQSEERVAHPDGDRAEIGHARTADLRAVARSEGEQRVDFHVLGEAQDLVHVASLLVEAHRLVAVVELQPAGVVGVVGDEEVGDVDDKALGLLVLALDLKSGHDGMTDVLRQRRGHRSSVFGGEALVPVDQQDLVAHPLPADEPGVADCR